MEETSGATTGLIGQKRDRGEQEVSSPLETETHNDSYNLNLTNHANETEQEKKKRRVTNVEDVMNVPTLEDEKCEEEENEKSFEDSEDRIQDTPTDTTMEVEPTTKPALRGSNNRKRKRQGEEKSNPEAEETSVDYRKEISENPQLTKRLRGETPIIGNREEFAYQLELFGSDPAVLDPREPLPVHFQVRWQERPLQIGRPLFTRLLELGTTLDINRVSRVHFEIYCRYIEEPDDEEDEGEEKEKEKENENKNETGNEQEGKKEKKMKRVKAFFLKDLSSNGTYLNGVMLGKGKEVRLKDRDKITILMKPPPFEKKQTQIGYIFKLWKPPVPRAALMPTPSSMDMLKQFIGKGGPSRTRAVVDRTEPQPPAVRNPLGLTTQDRPDSLSASSEGSLSLSSSNADRRIIARNRDRQNLPRPMLSQVAPALVTAATYAIRVVSAYLVWRTAYSYLFE